MTWAVREANAGDADRCAEVHVSSWKAGYDGILPEDYLRGLTAEDRLPWWRETLSAPNLDRDLHVLVVEDVAGEVRGFGSTTGPHEAERAELAQLYLEPAVWGTGAAVALMSALLARLADQGVVVVTLRVARDNARACRFYERGGWIRSDGAETTEEVWGVKVVTVEYRLELGQ
jgi:GNAT superfamily N-acetyltransferase